MHHPIQAIAVTEVSPNLISRLLRRNFLIVAFPLACLAFLPAASAVSPAPDGGYPNGNTAEGTTALFSLTTGPDNTAIGFQALYENTTGSSNTANGAAALFSNTSGNKNTANGLEALFHNTTGNDNTANGAAALSRNTTGNNNTATGLSALFHNTTGNDNTANGGNALSHNTVGFQNTADGSNALSGNTTGSNNTANGVDALFSNSSGSQNTANGVEALINNTIGGNNTAEGFDALLHNSTGNNNMASGVNALLNNTAGSNNIALGASAGSNLTIGNNNIDIGNAGIAGDSKKIRIGKPGTQNGTFIAGIRGVTTANTNAMPVVIDSAGQLGTISSSRRFKKEIKPMDKTSEAILGLKPVTFEYKSDDQAIPQYGLIAEEVAKVNPDLVVRDDDGEIYTVRYDAVNAMLLNEFLKAHRKVEEQASEIAQMKRQIEALTVSMQKAVVP